MLPSLLPKWRCYVCVISATTWLLYFLPVSWHLFWMLTQARLSILRVTNQTFVRHIYSISTTIEPEIGRNNASFWFRCLCASVVNGIHDTTLGLSILCHLYCQVCLAINKSLFELCHQLHPHLFVHHEGMPIPEQLLTTKCHNLFPTSTFAPLLLLYCAGWAS